MSDEFYLGDPGQMTDMNFQKYTEMPSYGTGKGYIPPDITEGEPGGILRSQSKDFGTLSDEDNANFYGYKGSQFSAQPPEQHDVMSSLGKLFETDAGARMMLGGIAMGAKGILDWQMQKDQQEARKEEINLMSQNQYNNQQNAIDADIKRKSSRAKLRNSTAQGPQPVLGIRG